MSDVKWLSPHLFKKSTKFSTEQYKEEHMVNYRTLQVKADRLLRSITISNTEQVGIQKSKALKNKHLHNTPTLNPAMSLSLAQGHDIKSPQHHGSMA